MSDKLSDLSKRVFGQSTKPWWDMRPDTMPWPQFAIHPFDLAGTVKPFASTVPFDVNADAFKPVQKQSKQTNPQETENYSDGDLAYTAGWSNLARSPQRPFSQDFPHNRYKANPDTGRMETDIDGRPVNPDAVIIGRAHENKDDVPLSDEDTDRIIEQLTGKPVQYKKLKDKSRGQYIAFFSELNPGEIFLKEGDFPAVQQVSKRHELGHAMDHIAGKSLDRVNDIPQDARNDLYSIYNEQRNSNYANARAANPGAKPEHFSLWSGHTPLHDDYTLVEAEDKFLDGRITKYYFDKERAELIADGIRAYMQDPNTMKARFPNAARYIRELVNTSPRVNKFIHFSDNSGRKNPYLPFAKQSRIG